MMLDYIKKILFSTKLTAFLLLIFAFAIGYATFIENDYGTAASKELIFNTKWFEIILLLLVINLIGNIFKFKLFRWEKASTLLFHVAFIIIIIGAAITRYISYEGSMHIREGQDSSTIVSSDTYLQFNVHDNKMQYSYDKKLFLNPKSNDEFDHEFDFEGNKIEIAYKDFIQNAIDTIISVEKGNDIIEIVTVGQGGRVSKYIKDGDIQMVGNYPVSFNNNSFEDAIQLTSTDSGIYVYSPYNIEYMSMDDKSTGILSRDTIHLFKNRRLYTINQTRMVFKSIHKNAAVKKVSVPVKSQQGEDALVVDITCNGIKREVMLLGGSGYISDKTKLELGGLSFALSYGSVSYPIPFRIHLNKFILDRYPGSMTPASYASEVTLLDDRSNLKLPHRIFMNNVLDYEGYRFFQSSYDPDEKGTILSVNHDFWGTTVTYIGYFLLFIGMILTLAAKKSRYSALKNTIKKLKKQRNSFVSILIAIFSLTTINTFAAKSEDNNKTNYVVINKKHAEKFSRLIIQDAGGRLKPIHTWASEVLRKISKRESFNNMNASQVILSMIYNNQYWQQEPMIYIDRNLKNLQKKLKATNNRTAFVNFFDKNFKNILSEDLNIAMRKKPGERTKYDKEVIKVNERAYICNMVYEGSALRLFPKENDPNNTWFTSKDYKKFDGNDSVFVKMFLPLYFNSITASFDKNDWHIADSTLSYVSDYQQKFGAKIYPSKSKIDMEIMYNKINIFKKLFMYYPLIGLLMLIFLFADIFKSKEWKKKAVNVLSIFLAVLFLLHTAGLIGRWYISGHAPWSNAYESMIFIAWVTMLAGFVFSRNNKMSLAATAILSCVILFVATLNWLDPEITNLVPVLKSYWLMIHVAVITGSYGFLGLGALLGFINLILMITKTAKNKDRINNTIKELTCIIEMTLIVGLFMATIGTFLGGVWANESWGRYWGWDPKETWALVIVLFYAMLLHLRFIPWAKGKYLFNLLSVLGIGTIVMTYLGVNYYLSGLHSYAAGDAMPFPTSLTYTIIVVLIIAPIAYFRNKKFKL